ncbi:hypothetical protein [Endozoicomonas sp. GU-1]|uniref:hypothetical protein n=1 Tax=Endozoicomonas sp. GU-1 TaxID=3009078 RepID=UPI0022B30A1A|nr:hypothetical protein [Endozoicomonas sp. GU-1]WBA83389.1 hypothetical protein O2T12_09825 [Endozoicomonas sp. GU-1]
MQEPDAEAAINLRKSLFSAWQECHQWLLGETKSNALWSPEWFGWLAYSGLYTLESPWQSFSFSFLLLDLCLEQVPTDCSSDIKESFCESLGRLASMISDESKEPLFLAPLLETELLNNHSLKDIKAISQGYETPDRFSTEILNSLQSLAESWEKLPGHFKRFGQIIHLEKIRSVINDAILVLNQCIPDSQPVAQEITDGLQTSDSTCDGSMSVSPLASKVLNRDSARLTIQELLTFFRRTEPHSPVSWQLETALNWLDLSFPELLLKMTGEQQELYQDISRRLGMVDTLSIGEKNEG